MCARKLITHTQHHNITTSQHHTRYYIHTNCHSAAKTVVIITDRLVFFFFAFWLSPTSSILARETRAEICIAMKHHQQTLLPHNYSHILCCRMLLFLLIFVLFYYMRSYWRERCVKPNFIITDILSARIFAVLLNALSLFLVVVSFLYALASVDKMHEMCFHGNNGTEMNVKKKTKITSEKSCACNCVHHRDATDFCVETETDV